MLLFIIKIDAAYSNVDHFKTSYVTVYPHPVRLPWLRVQDFKTSYVTVYHYKRARGNCNGVISKHRMLLFILKTKMPPQGVSHFKTSYVTVYRQFPTAPGRRKYISKHRMLLFIADAPELFEQIKTISKHRMLLFIEGIGLKKGQGVYFKTSYVTVYRE